jgi:transcription initiation factor IIE alpha subunit
MDIDALHSALLSIVVLSKKLRCMREHLTVKDGAPSALAEFLHEVERDLQVTKATLAGELGFALCPRCCPPETVTTDLEGRVNCPSCGRAFDEQTA